MRAFFSGLCSGRGALLLGGVLLGAAGVGWFFWPERKPLPGQIAVQFVRADGAPVHVEGLELALTLHGPNGEQDLTAGDLEQPLAGLAVGPYRLTASGPWIDAAEVELTVHSGPNEPVVMPLAFYGDVPVAVDAAGTMVSVTLTSVNGKSRPLSRDDLAGPLRRLPVGDYRLGVKGEWIDPVEQSFTVVPGPNDPVATALDIYGVVQIVLEPPELAVEVLLSRGPGEEPKKLTPEERKALRLPVGQQEVIVKAPAIPERKITFEVLPGRATPPVKVRPVGEKGPRR